MVEGREAYPLVGVAAPEPAAYATNSRLGGCCQSTGSLAPRTLSLGRGEEPDCLGELSNQRTDHRPCGGAARPSRPYSLPLHLG